MVDEGLEVLSEEECRELLALEHVGRVGVTMQGLPVIVPVNYALVDGDIVFRTSPGTRLQAATQRAVIAFEVDSHDTKDGPGWSVLVIGRSSNVTDDGEHAELEQRAIMSWPGVAHTRYVRIRPEVISGQRIANR